ncbi:heavy metal-associated isoprenylated plant protein 44-like [Phalaenopsis equestris]|uniref:heavy metal-associated isoprenylated plant protein 44-like n=1 Tax=Phalaenopsis equestris TaxID=78828 RepID=UPI0009E650CC|nr:heavy metal-associated isoprenylated plant protein 44-like [Phalaenopsis equestris]
MEGHAAAPDREASDNMCCTFDLVHFGKRADIIEIDMDNPKVIVTGYVNQSKVLKFVSRIGRQAEFWPSRYDDAAALFNDDNVHACLVM